jgi:Ca2+:H+ antiporter
MIRKFLFSTSAWSIVVPLASIGILAAVWGRPLGWNLLPFVIVALIAAVLVAVHHAEVIALRVGEPFGTLILALSVTIIEVSLIVSLMLSGGAGVSTLARDTVYATVMIVCNGTVGLCLLMGALRHRVLVFRVEGTNPALSVLATLTVLTLVLPSFTSSTPGPTLSQVQLALGSALATIGLTIPAVAATSIALGLQLDLGLPPKEMVLLVLTLMISAMTLAGGRSTVLQGAVHLVLFAVFLFLAIVP